MKLALAAVVLAICAGSVLAADGSMPDKYRFTGWMSPSKGGNPRHVVFDGDGPVLGLADSWNLTSHATPYTACVAKLGTSRRTCFRGRVPRSTGESIHWLPVRCCGTFRATWTVEGRIVARWDFLYKPETSHARRSSFVRGRQPTIREREEITSSYPRSIRNAPVECVFMDIRVSEQDRRYAVAGPQVVNWEKRGSRCLRYASNGVDVLKKTDGRWRSVFSGSVEPPCSLGIPHDLIDCRGRR